MSNTVKKYFVRDYTVHKKIKTVHLKIQAKESDYLYKEESQINGAGLGLFTAIPIYKDEIIAVFSGEIITPLEAEQRAGKGLDSYFLNLPNGNTLDTYNSKCFAGYANDAEGFSKSQFKNNAEIQMTDNQIVCLVAKKQIASGEEVFCAYGKKYWKRKD